MLQVPSVCDLLYTRSSITVTHFIPQRNPGQPTERLDYLAPISALFCLNVWLIILNKESTFLGGLKVGTVGRGC
jgi:hypothetical protein